MTTFTPDYGKLQRMQDDAIVRRFMAQIDTKIDTIVLQWRVEDDERDGYASRPYWLFKSDHALAEHDNRPDDLQQMIEEIRGSDGDIDPEREFFRSPGRYEGNEDRYLAYVLDYAGRDYADDETGSTEWSTYILRFGRVLLCTDDRGFVDATIYPDEETAKIVFERAEDAYSQWDEDTFEELGG